MENKANYHLIGAFVIISLISLFAFLIWIARIDFDQEYKEFDIYFSESVFGLTKASQVTYNGIPVGDVRNITIAKDDPSKVMVRIRIKEEIPILEDTMATLGMQGITGVLFVQIIGGQPGSLPLVSKEGQERPVIPSRPSTLEEFFGGGGDLINRAMQTFERLNLLFSTENIESFTQTLNNIESLSGDLAEEGETIQQTLQGLRDTIKTAERLFQQDIKPAAEEFRQLSQKANQLVNNLDQLVTENRENISRFTGATMSELKLLISDMRELTQAITALAERLEENPSDIIITRPESEYEVEK